MTYSKKTVFYPFSLNIPWQTENRSICPNISSELWNKYIKNKNANLLCPGYLVEIIISYLSKNILESRGVQIKNWITPSYYDNLLNLFGAKISSREFEDPISGFNRISEATESYPTPIFFDKNKNVYFNMLFNYGIKHSTNNNEIGRNSEPFYKQILNNLCSSTSNLNLNKLNLYKTKEICNKYLEKFKISCEDKYVIIDNSSLFLNTADKRIINQSVIFPIQIKYISDRLKEKKIYVITMSSDILSYEAVGIDKIIPSWNMISSDIIFSLLINSYGVISCDQNLYLTAAMFGVKNIISLEEQVKGWSFDDIKNISINHESCNWEILKENNSVYDIFNIIKENL